MLEKLYSYALVAEKTIEKIVDDENVNVNHMVLPKGDALPEHYSNSNVYMIVAQGTITLQLNEQDNHSYEKGSIINIPYNTKMNVFNDSSDLAEIFVVKAPAPAAFK
ncbi:cupin domain-containing protein [Alkalibacter saccharofermentans]|uniref:Cupin domain protein n=1 Tax=Alkalibacter saccharofermentans DSM 14828 TaxID=1120975 RepID=A0A1M4XX41_9FIRM|nr:cupin domain-containing protein [Alkalibacter saccharofermentans]SHE98029.1 Cupin domain protein [Alkalibacter saccharofermentans DSM 14828]